MRDILLGNEGRKGRLLIEWDADAGRWLAAHYRGTKKHSQLRVAACPRDELKKLWEASNEVERRTASSSNVSDAIGKALDLPALDRDVETIVRYLEEVPA